MTVLVRMPESLHHAIAEDVQAWAARGRETFLFLLLTKRETSSRTLYIARSVVRLAEGEAVRQAMRTYPTEAFTRRFYGALRAAEVLRDSIRIAAVHSHPFSNGKVAFSGIDRASFADDRGLFSDLFAVEFLGLVVDHDVSAFDGVVVDTAGFTPITGVQVVGRTVRRLLPPAEEASK